MSKWFYKAARQCLTGDSRQRLPSSEGLKRQLEIRQFALLQLSLRLISYLTKRSLKKELEEDVKESYEATNSEGISNLRGWYLKADGPEGRKYLINLIGVSRQRTFYVARRRQKLVFYFLNPQGIGF
ncbi:MAG: hypothetical protein DRO43_06370 [Candidatus Hecatellales archaeon]|nr:MAG: hypothetical protein DRO43_06370 [Candidatus Hecatellales archaeon]